MLRQRTRDEKKAALVDQEAVLQERIDKANDEMRKAIQIREEMGLIKDDKAPAGVETNVTNHRPLDHF